MYCWTGPSVQADVRDSRTGQHSQRMEPMLASSMIQKQVLILNNRLSSYLYWKHTHCWRNFFFKSVLVFCRRIKKVLIFCVSLTFEMDIKSGLSTFLNADCGYLSFSLEKQPSCCDNQPHKSCSVLYSCSVFSRVIYNGGETMLTKQRKWTIAGKSRFSSPHSGFRHLRLLLIRTFHKGN